MLSRVGNKHVRTRSIFCHFLFLKFFAPGLLFCTQFWEPGAICFSAGVNCPWCSHLFPSLMLSFLLAPHYIHDVRIHHLSCLIYFLTRMDTQWKLQQDLQAFILLHVKLVLDKYQSIWCSLTIFCSPVNPWLFNEYLLYISYYNTFE